MEIIFLSETQLNVANKDLYNTNDDHIDNTVRTTGRSAVAALNFDSKVKSERQGSLLNLFQYNTRTKFFKVEIYRPPHN